MASVNIKTFYAEIRNLQAQIDELKLQAVPVIQDTGDVVKAEPAEPTGDGEVDVLVQYVFDEKVAKTLIDGGYEFLSDVAAATDDELRAVSGIGPARLTEIRSILSKRG